MIEFDHFFNRPDFHPWRDQFKAKLSARLQPGRHGDLPTWLALLDSLPDLKPSIVQLDSDTVTLGHSDDLSDSQQRQLDASLRALSPWRKGPYQLFDTFIDTEWRSDWKWRRVVPHLSALQNRKVLDVGCGTGYHGWRMLGAGADYVMGIDPSVRFLIQFNAVQKYACNQQYDFLPIGIEDMPTDMAYFDTIFSMGVLYHRRNPINHLIELKNLMVPGGELVLETLIIDDYKGGIFTPKSRYAQMRNVWSVMTVDKLASQLESAGFNDIRCVDQNVTSLEEQRRTDWMQFHSLREFLDPQDISNTIEGYPAPKRGLFIASKPLQVNHSR